MSKIINEKRFSKTRENQGYLVELCRLNKEAIIENDLIEKLPMSVKKSLLNEFSLYEWITMLQALQIRNPFDIRLTEWFSLAFICEIAKAIKSIDRELSSKGVIVHPQNIIIPEFFFSDSSFQNITWDNCKELIKENIRDIDFIEDGITEDVSLFHASNSGVLDKFYDVRYFGIILLCSCIKSFQLPNAWNVPRLAEVYENSILLSLSQNPLSTWTNAIIYACLSARSKESIWQLRLNVVHQNVDDDTVFEQLTIRSVDEFINEIQNAIEILEKFQLSVFNQEPRHLIPIHIDQILKKDFLTLKLSNR